MQARCYMAKLVSSSLLAAASVGQGSCDLRQLCHHSKRMIPPHPAHTDIQNNLMHHAWAASALCSLLKNKLGISADQTEALEAALLKRLALQDSNEFYKLDKTAHNIQIFANDVL